MLGKNEMAVLNIIAANNWERPIYIDHSLIYTGNIPFLDWLQFEGLAYRFVPIKTPRKGIENGRIDTDILYNNVMNKFVWGNVNDPDVHLDEYNKKQINIMQTRYMFARLASALVNEGKKEKAVEVVDKMFELFPNAKIPYDYSSFPAVEQYYRAGANEKANQVVRIMMNNSLALINYYLSLPENLAITVEADQNRELSNLRNLVVITQRYKQDELYQEIDAQLKSLIDQLENQS